MDDEARGIGSRGTGNRGTSNRGTSAPAQLAAAAGSPGNKALAATQARAEKLVADLLPFFTSTFSWQKAKGKTEPYNKRIGKPVPVKVLDAAAFLAEEKSLAKFGYSQELRALVTYRPQWVSDRLVAIRKFGPLRGKYGDKIDSHTILHPDDAHQFYSEVRISRPTNAAAFYSEEKSALFVLQGQVDVAVVAHELCHAYCDPVWTEFQLELSAYLLTLKMNALDEGVTSELASLVLYNWFSSQGGGSPASGTAPDGYVGYGRDVQRQGALFLEKAEGKVTSTPGPTTMEAYFEGQIRLALNEEKPVDSVVQLGRKKKRIKLSELLT